MGHLAVAVVSFTIPGRLRGKGRPRAQIRAGKNGRSFVHIHPDDKTLNAEAMLRSMAAEAMAGRPPLECPLILKIEIVINRTASWSKRKKAEAVHVTGKPDLDNVAKLVGDALNGIIWGDDSQICEMHIRRRYDDACGEHAKIWVMKPQPVAVAA